MCTMNQKASLESYGIIVVPQFMNTSVCKQFGLQILSVWEKLYLQTLYWVMNRTGVIFPT